MKNYFVKRNQLATEFAVGGTADPSEGDIAEKQDNEKSAANVEEGSDFSRVPNPEAQGGVKKIEAVTLTWTKNELILAYAWSVAIYLESNRD